MKPTYIITLFSALVVAGCGGGGGSASTGGEQNLDLGTVTSRSVGAASSPVVVGSRNAVFTGVAGANFTDVRLRYPNPSGMNLEEALDQTYIIYNKKGSPWLYDYGTGRKWPLFTERSLYGNSSFPSISANRVALSYWNSSTNFFEAYTCNLDGSNLKQVSTPGSDYVEALQISPDGARVAYRRLDSIYKIYVVPASGGTPVVVSPAGQSCTQPVWRPDGRISFWNGSIGKIQSTLPNGSDLKVEYTPNATPSSFCWSSSGRDLYYVHFNNSAYRIRRITPNYEMEVFSSAEQIGRISHSPVGNLLLIGNNASDIIVRDLVDGTSNTILVAEGDMPQWGPFMPTRTLVGTGAAFGANAAGFLFSQIDKRVPSFVTFDATTRSTAVVQSDGNDNPTQANTILRISADKLTALRYMNDLKSSATSLTLVPNTVGALVSFSSDSGEVTSVITYTASVSTPASRGNQRTYKGEFNAIYDGEGKNLAPNGASEVVLDPESGRLLSFR